MLIGCYFADVFTSLVTYLGDNSDLGDRIDLSNRNDLGDRLLCCRVVVSEVFQMKLATR